MPNEPEVVVVAIARISNDLTEIFVKLMGKAPDPEVVQAEAEALVARYGPDATFEDMLV